jgi:putative SOS response-associated peptidase YedK
MCSRFAFVISKSDLQKAFPWVDFPPKMPGSYNIAPSQPIPIIKNQDPTRLDFGLWGLIAPYEKDPSAARKFLNARSETVFEKTTFKNPVKHRRCLIPASGFYEWKSTSQGKETYYFTMEDESPMALGGIYSVWEGIDGSILQSCAILTTAANSLMAEIHPRMPVIVRPELYDRWLEKIQPSEAYLKPTFAPYPAKEMKTRRVSSYVNNVRHDGPECIAPYDPNLNEKSQFQLF